MCIRDRAELVTSFGNWYQTNDQINFGGHTQRFAYYASLNANRSNYGLQAPIGQVVHDAENGYGGFASFTFNPDPKNQLRLVASLRQDFYQIPIDPNPNSEGNEIFPSFGLRDSEREPDGYVTFSWIHTFNPNLILTVSPVSYTHLDVYKRQALEYAERLVAVHPDDSEMMLLAIGLLQQQGSDASLTRAAGYATRVLDRIEKATPGEKSARVSVKDWQSQQDRFRAALYSLRGQIEKSQKAYEAAAKDFQQSYAIRSSALAAEQLGEIAEMKNDYTKAVDEYLLAFVLPEEGPAGKVDRREVRKKLGNVWRQVHGSEQGLGEQILVTYDHLGATSANLNPPARNKGAKDSFSFVLRNLDGSPLPLAPLKGKVVVLSFWATWCLSLIHIYGELSSRV